MINKEAGLFNGRQQVTCYSCHRGSIRQVAMPAVLESDMPMRPDAPVTPAAGAPAAATVDQILNKYLEAVGGADALKTVTSRVMKGAWPTGSETAIELYTKAADKRVSISHLGQQR